MKKRTDLMTGEEYLEYMAAQAIKRGKYNNAWVEYNGQKFQSKAERDRFMVLEHKMNIGEIGRVTRQKVFVITINGIEITKYRCDFFYKTSEGAFIVEDVKGFVTEEYLIKKRLMKVCYNVDIVEPNLDTPATKKTTKFYNRRKKV